MTRLDQVTGGPPTRATTAGATHFATTDPTRAVPPTRRLPADAVDGPDSACLPSSSTRGDIPASADRPGARR